MRNLLWLLLGWLVGSPLSAATVDTLSVRSGSMGKNVRVIVMAPDGAKLKDGPRFPVLYLLHGHDGDATSWLSVQPDLARMAERDGIVVVCPEIGNNWYWDSPKDPSVRYETFVGSELPAYIDSRFRTRADRSGRAITGLSMGGHGAMWLSMRHKDTFGAAGSTSGGLDILPFPDNWNMKDLLGEKASNEKAWEEHTAINQIDRIQNGDLAIIIDCGYGDFFFDVNNRFHARLLERGIDHDYLVRPGGHNVPYWNNALDYQWLFFRKFFDRAAK